MGILALSGGHPVRTLPFPQWPQYDESERQQLAEVLGIKLRSGAN